MDGGKHFHSSLNLCFIIKMLRNVSATIQDSGTVGLLLGIHSALSISSAEAPGAAIWQ